MPSTSNFDLTYNQQNVVAGGALSNSSTTPTGTGGGGVDQIIAGSNITISPTSGVGTVTISATGGGGSTTGQSILAGDNAGGFQNVSLTGLSYNTTSHVLSTNNNGNVVGPSTGATDGNVALYDGTIVPSGSVETKNSSGDKKVLSPFFNIDRTA